MIGYPAVKMIFLKKDKNTLVDYTFGSLCGLNCCSNCVWFILGFFWRFSRGGRVSAGERLDKDVDGWLDESKEKGYQVYGGLFISAYFYTLLAIIITIGLGGSIMFMLACVYNDQDNEQFKMDSQRSFRERQRAEGAEDNERDD